MQGHTYKRSSILHGTAKWPVNIGASLHKTCLWIFLFIFFPPKASFQNPFRERRYAIDLKPLSRGSDPPTTTTTTISRASHSVMLTEARSEQGHCLHLPLPAVWAEGSWERGCWLRRIHHRVGGLEKQGSRWGEERGRWEMWRSVLQDVFDSGDNFWIVCVCVRVCAMAWLWKCSNVWQRKTLLPSGSHFK